MWDRRTAGVSRPVRPPRSPRASPHRPADTGRSPGDTMTNLFDLTGEVAAVFGGTGVLGGAMADALAAAGATVAVLGRSEERGTERVKAIQKAGGKAHFVSADAMSPDSLTKARD